MSFNDSATKKKKKKLSQNIICVREKSTSGKQRDRINKQGWGIEHCLWLVEETPALHMTPGFYRKSEHLLKTFILSFNASHKVPLLQLVSGKLHLI